MFALACNLLNRKEFSELNGSLFSIKIIFVLKFVKTLEAIVSIFFC